MTHFEDADGWHAWHPYVTPPCPLCGKFLWRVSKQGKGKILECPDCEISPKREIQWVQQSDGSRWKMYRWIAFEVED
jgi:hypothetical protein